MKKDLNYYMSLPYHAEIVKCEEGGYFARIVELEGCMTQGETVEELFKMIEDAKLCWLSVALEDGVTIPEPDDKEYSGQFNIRIPKTLHKNLVLAARTEGVSLNQYILHMLSKNEKYPKSA